MNKTVDVNEITLEKEKKSFVKTNKILYFVFIVLQILSLMLAIMASIMLIISGAVHDIKMMYVTLSLMVVSVGYFIAFNHARNLFNIFKSGESPFRYDVADKMKGAATAIIATNITIFIIGLLFWGIVYFFKFNIEEFSDMRITLDLGNLVLGIMIYAFSYVFSYGAKLQQESDETL